MSTAVKARVDGFLNVDKPYGITSMEVVRRVKRACGIKRVGHGGTLDPVATGVVPVCLGQATRLMEYVIDGTKDYRAVVELGVETDTYDSLGQVTARSDPSEVDRAAVERALEPFQGVIQQVPPMYSALKKQGKRLYELARAGIEVEREPRAVKVFSTTLVDWSAPLITVEVTCGRGFYMRSLAHDLGQALGCGAHLKSLIRLRTGPFRVADAIALPEAREPFPPEAGWQEALHAPDTVLSGLPAVIVGTQREGMLRDGRGFPSRSGPPDSGDGARCRAYGVNGGFIGILKFDVGTWQWRPDKIFAAA